MTAIASIPPGFWADPQGRLVPEGQIKTIDKVRTGLVIKCINDAKALQEKMQDFKLTIMSEITAFVEVAAADYGTSLGGVKGNLTLRSFDGLREIKLQVADRLVFDERLKVAEKLVGDCLNDWAADARPELKAIVERAFKADKDGNISTSAVLSLRRLEIDDDRWKQAMKAIADSLLVTGTKSYVRFYERDAPDQPTRAISLDLASL